jgi:hypothetical protein
MMRHILHAAAVAVMAATTAACATPAAAPAAAPVSTTATLTGTCATGWLTFDSGQIVAFTPFPGTDVGGPGVLPGYQVKLTNTGRTTAEVTSFSVVFFSRSTEIGSDGQGPFDQFITPGQSLRWTELTDVMDTGLTGAVDASATCQLVKWTA